MSAKIGAKAFQAVSAMLRSAQIVVAHLELQPLQKFGRVFEKESHQIGIKFRVAAEALQRVGVVKHRIGSLNGTTVASIWRHRSPLV